MDFSATIGIVWFVMNKVYSIREKQASSFLHLIGKYDEKVKLVLFDMFSLRNLIMSDKSAYDSLKENA